MVKKTKKKTVKFINIKQAAEMLGVNPETLRRWDRKRKLKAKRHPMNNYRVYKLSDVIKLGRKIGA